MMNRRWIPHLARLAGLLVLVQLELLEQKRWLLKGDVLKTALILERGKRTR